jgi:hypothetical protein
MLRHVAWQMEIIEGGLGDKMEDWVERLQQTGMRLRQQYRTAQNPIVCADARERASLRSAHPDMIARTNATNEGERLREGRQLQALGSSVGGRRIWWAAAGGRQGWCLGSDAVAAVAMGGEWRRG